MDVKVGDVVHVRGVVDSDAGWGFPQVVFDGAGPPICVMPTCIVHVEPRPLQVGDKVRIVGKNDIRILRIIGIAGKDAWTEWPDGDHTTLPLANLERI